mgnify:CR=1 FL=1
MDAKAINDAVAYIRSLAELRGRNADWAEAAVRGAASLSAGAALEQGVIEIVARDMDELMAALDGRAVTDGSRNADHLVTTLRMRAGAIRAYEERTGFKIGYKPAGGIAIRKDRLTSLGAWVLDGSRHFERLVTGGTRQDLFDVDYSADTTYADAALRWTLDERWQLGGAWRHYDNDGDFPVSRDDLEGFVEIALPREYALRLSWREVDFEEDRIETYDARILEAAVRLAF